jgi:hypothetical protein
MMKKKLRLTLPVAALLGMLVDVSAAEFKVYPGAKLDDRATKAATDAAQSAGMHASATIYTAGDAFDKVAAYYRNLGTEYNMPMASGTAGKPKKHEGFELWEAYFIFDGAKDLSASKSWAKVQRPGIGLYPEDLRDIAHMKPRDLTVIVYSQTK